MALTKLFAWLGLTIGFAILVLQFAITIPARMDAGYGLASAIVFYFSFFTILSNIAIMLVHLVTVRPVPWLGWFDSQITRAMMASIITLVLLAYHFLLAPVWDPQGLFKVADVGLHYITPLIYLAMWLVWQPRKVLPWSAGFFMLVPPMLYLAYAMTRGAISGQYPYYFIDAGEHGYGLVALNIATLLVALLTLNFLALAIDRFRSIRFLKSSGN